MVAGTTSRVFINEFHYDNDATDSGEFIEIANADGIDLTGWSVVLYNGSALLADNSAALPEYLADFLRWQDLSFYGNQAIL